MQLPELPDNFINIDRLRLDDECLRQAPMMFDASVAYHEAQIKLADAKAALDLIRADLLLKICKRPDVYGYEKKPTNPEIDALIETNKEVYNKTQEILQLEANVKMYSAAVNALDHRKRMLELLVSLHGQSYFASPSVGDNASKPQPKRTMKDPRKK